MGCVAPMTLAICLATGTQRSRAGLKIVPRLLRWLTLCITRNE